METDLSVVLAWKSGQRVAMREGAVTGVTGLSFLFGDHLGSTSVTATGALHSQLLGFYSSLCLKCGNWITRRIE